MNILDRDDYKTSLFKHIINNVVIKTRIGKCIRTSQNTNYYTNGYYFGLHYCTWDVIKETPHLLCQYGSLKQVKEMVEGKLERKYSKYKWSNDNYSDTPFIPCLNVMIKYSISGNHLDTIQYLYNRYKLFKDEMMYGMVSFALSVGNLEIAKYIGDECDCKYPLSHRDLDVHRMVSLERKELLEYFMEVNEKYYCLGYYKGDRHKIINPYHALVEAVVQYGHLDLFKTIHENKFKYGREIFDGYFFRKVTIMTAKHGQLAILQYIYANFTKGLEPFEMIIEATKSGHLDVFTYIDVNSKEQITDYNELIKLASNHGHVDIVYYILNKRIQEDKKGFEWAGVVVCDSGNIDVIKYIFETFPELPPAIDPFYLKLDRAIEDGRLEEVKFVLGFYDNKIEERYNIAEAANNNHFEMVKYLLESGWGLYKGYLDQCNNLEVLKYIQSHLKSPLNFSEKALEIPFKTNNMEMIEFIIHNASNIDRIGYCYEYISMGYGGADLLQRLLILIPPRDTWKFSDFLCTAVKNNQPQSLLRLFVENFPIDINSWSFLYSIQLTVRFRNMDSFIYLMSLYKGNKYFIFISEDNVIEDGETEPKFIKYLIQHYGDKLNYKTIIEECFQKLPINIIKYIQDTAVSLNRLDISSLNIPLKAMYGDGKIQYVTENYPHIKNTSNQVIDCNISDIPTRSSLKYFLKYRHDFPLDQVWWLLRRIHDQYKLQPFKCILLLYKYYHQPQTLVYKDDNMDIIRFINFNHSDHMDIDYKKCESYPIVHKFLSKQEKFRE